MHDPRAYTYRVFRSEADGCFVASTLEFPSLSCLGDTQDEALHGMVDVVREALEILEGEGREAPLPMGSRRYSGHLSLRIPPEEHRRVAMEAAEAGVSINQLVAARI
ncbi:type II toxin-antitoxin system HicB family antitoxin [Thermophilibacter sp. ET337]|uniref:type II toxin-antitoxin system HicB family antitoxin n=1 Tax=Thermophilibacter sp. ET337 TaxID=2973084 RepID=UPI0021AC3EDA|nr:type II toxin-antitoxin system HicB family antitoxin [Thermophilibacter sp. ET337]MCR8907147.1 type II toxin-antitoxin system HicB family antitoxin [Thermophilibacter sp. ET337]